MFTLKIETDNAAFEDELRGPELARILRAVADRLADLGSLEDRGALYDSNGNNVGNWTLRA